MKLENYLQDGAHPQERAVLAFLHRYSDIESSWNDEHKRYDGQVDVGRWENCREQGYVVSIRSKNCKQLNIAFFEHRNSDSICAIVWEQSSINTLTIDNAEFGEVYKTKHDVSHEVGYGEAYEMSEWIGEQLTNFWNNNIK